MLNDDANERDYNSKCRVELCIAINGCQNKERNVFKTRCGIFVRDSMLKAKELLIKEAKTGDRFTKCVQYEDNLVDFDKLLAR